MKRLTFIKHMIRDERGQILPMVLVFLLVGGLTITPTLDLATTTLQRCRASEENVKGYFAADAGAQYAVWCLENSVDVPAQLAENINDMDVSLQVEDMGGFTLYFGELVQAGKHSSYLGVSGEMVWDDPAQAYKYTITVNWQPGSGKPTIHLVGIGARLPVNYTYQEDSAAEFVDNLTLTEPDIATDGAGAYMVNWEFHGTLPYVSETQPVVTQSFYATGTGDLEGHYAWVVANRNDIGESGEISGNLYFVTATATVPGTGETISKIEVGVLQRLELTEIVSWRISK